MLEVYGNYYSEDDPGRSSLASGITDWDEVTPEEYEDLKLLVRHHRSQDGRQLVLVAETDQYTVKKLMSDYLEEAKAYKKRVDDATKKRQQAELKRLAAAESKRVAKERQKYEELKRKYEGLHPHEEMMGT